MLNFQILSTPLQYKYLYYGNFDHTTSTYRTGNNTTGSSTVTPVHPTTVCYTLAQVVICYSDCAILKTNVHCANLLI